MLCITPKTATGPAARSAARVVGVETGSVPTTPGGRFGGRFGGGQCYLQKYRRLRELRARRAMQRSATSKCRCRRAFRTREWTGMINVDAAPVQ